MFTVDLNKEISAISKETEKEAEDFLKNIVEHLSKEDFDLKTEIERAKGLFGTNIRNRNEKRAKKAFYKTRIDTQKIFGEDILDEEEIKKLALKYHLKFLPAEQYVGYIDPNAYKALASFMHKHKEKFTIIERSQIFILAPSKAFVSAREIEPVLFVRVYPESFKWGNQYLYKKIYQWGNDFTIARRVLGFISSLSTTGRVG